MLSPTIESETIISKKFIDFDKNEKSFYNNLYLDDCKIVIKIPIKHPKTEEEIDIKIEKFNLCKYVYLLSYE